MDEFEFIDKYLAPLAGPEGLGLKDDAALYKPPPGYDLVLTKDTMVEGVHFPKGDIGARTAQKLLRVNLSDLAAKGAKPAGYLLSLAIPENRPFDAFVNFANGLAAAQSEFKLSLFGGDTVSINGPMVATVTLLGTVPSGKMVPRNGAKVGDGIYVTGTIGDAYLGLKSVFGSIKADSAARGHWERAYYEPVPRLIFRKILRDYASACADISDGLIADCDHIARASGVRFVIDAEKVPLSNFSKTWLSQNSDLPSLLTGGDDYELVFTCNPADEQNVIQAARGTNVALVKIGQVTKGQGTACLNSDGVPLTFEATGYQHF